MGDRVCSPVFPAVRSRVGSEDIQLASHELPGPRKDGQGFYLAWYRGEIMAPND